LFLYQYLLESILLGFSIPQLV